MHPTPPPLLQLHPNDNVAIARRPLLAGEQLHWNGRTLPLHKTIPTAHKVALREIPSDHPVIKYGQIIGFASHPTQPGDWVHTHNLEARPFDRPPATLNPQPPHPTPRPHPPRSFPGFQRPLGRVGTRNYLGVLTTVNCSASAARYVRDQFRDHEIRRSYPNVDGVVAFTFKGGCGMSAGEPLQILQRVLRGMARHPNLGGVIVLGLGCEVNQLPALRETFHPSPHPSPEHQPVWLQVQEAGGLRKVVEAGVAAVTRLLPQVNACHRSPQPVDQLALALNCGGSDAHSGITANPALGVASDALIACGGTAVLAETPEIYGAEHLLAARAVSPSVRDKLLDRIRWWETEVQRWGMEIDNNPSPGNKAGGLTTIYEKSLGAVAKGGQAPLSAVLEYAEPITQPGLCFMDTPGFDPVSMTGLVSGGCTIGVFTTGRGSVYGCKPSPCIKVATHTPLYQWMEDDMDLNAGTILDGTEWVAQVGQRIFEEIIAVAGGKRTKSELAGIGDEEFAPWLLGPTF
jgi:altronate hydrolase